MTERLERIGVIGLFGRLNHNIPINNDDSITIITAPNGYGKTVILNILKFFFQKDFYRIQSYKFTRIELDFSDGRRVFLHAAPDAGLLDKIIDDDESSNLNKLYFEPINFGPDCEGWQFQWSESVQIRSSSLERYLPFLTNIGPDRWLHDHTGAVLSFIDVLKSYSDELPERFTGLTNIPDWLEEVINQTECHLIETQRLLQINVDYDPYRPRRIRKSRSVVERNAKDLEEKIGIALQNYANDSQQLDQSFPRRILAQLYKSPPDEDNIREGLGQIEMRRGDLARAGLLDESFSPPITAHDSIDETNILNILNVFIDDTNKKLSVFDDLYSRIDLFKKIMQAHFKFKKLHIQANIGMNITDDDNNEIPLNSLSSGEQHELVLIYELLFKVSDNALILIDEPELSLHVAWQKRFIGDLQEIQLLRPLNIVMATHSPQIINDRWDLTVDLSGASTDERNSR